MLAPDLGSCQHVTSQPFVVLSKSASFTASCAILSSQVLWTDFFQCVGFVDFLTFCKLNYHGFHFHRTALSRFLTLFPLRPITFLSRQQSPVKHLTYWHRPHTSRTKLPIVFIHGIGIGLYPYVDFLQELSSTSGIERGGLDEQVGIIAIEIMPVSFRITHQALGKEEICDEIQTIIEHHGFSKYVLTAHSYGTAVATYMLKSERTSNNIGPVVLIDPITILLHLPDVAYNFTRRQPAEANEHQLYYFASMDMGVSHTLARSFFWSEAILWKSDFGGRPVTCSLAQRDLIVNTEAVGRYLASPDCDSTNYANRNDACNGFIESNKYDYGESDGNGYAKNSGFAMANGHIHEGHDTITNSHVKAPKKEDEDLLTAGDWKSRPWRGQGLEILRQNGLDHAQVFDSANRRKGLISAIKTYSAQLAD
jgi:pimeloyl-ACP methyl ester carboxylesterase